MYNPDVLWEMTQTRRRDLLDEAARARAARAAQHAEPRWANRLLVRLRASGAAWIAARVFEPAPPPLHRQCCTQT